MPDYGAFLFEDVELEIPTRSSPQPSVTSVPPPPQPDRNFLDNDGPRGDPGMIREIPLERNMDNMGIAAERFVDADIYHHHQTDPPLINAQGDGGMWWSPVQTLIGLVPVKTLVGREMDPLTETGVAHIFIVISLVVLLVVLFALFLRSYRSNRRGYRGQIRQLSNEYYSGTMRNGTQERKHDKRKHDEGKEVGGWLSRFWPRGKRGDGDRLVERKNGSEKKKKKKMY